MTDYDKLGDRVFGRLFLTRQSDTFDITERVRVVSTMEYFSATSLDGDKAGLWSYKVENHGEFEPSTTTLVLPKRPATAGAEARQTSWSPLPPGCPRRYAVAVRWTPGRSFVMRIGAFSIDNGHFLEVQASASGGYSFRIVKRLGGMDEPYRQHTWNIDTFGALRDKSPSGQSLADDSVHFLIEHNGTAGPTRLSFVTADGRTWPAHIFPDALSDTPTVPCRVEAARTDAAADDVHVTVAQASVRAPAIASPLARLFGAILQKPIPVRGSSTKVVVAWRVPDATSANRSIFLNTALVVNPSPGLARCRIRYLADLKDGSWIDTTGISKRSTDAKIRDDNKGMDVSDFVLGPLQTYPLTFAPFRYSLGAGQALALLAQRIEGEVDVSISLSWYEST